MSREQLESAAVWLEKVAGELRAADPAWVCGVEVVCSRGLAEDAEVPGGQVESGECRVRVEWIPED